MCFNSHCKKFSVVHSDRPNHAYWDSHCYISSPIYLVSSWYYISSVLSVARSSVTSLAARAK